MPGVDAVGADGPHWFAGCGMLVAVGFPCFTPEGMVVAWSMHGADPKCRFAGQYDEKIGGAKRAIVVLPAR